MKWLAIRLNSQRWSVWLVKPNSKSLISDGRRCLGLCNFERCRIYLDSSQGEQALEDTLFHELLHAALFVSGADAAYGCSAKIEEGIVKPLTSCWHGLMKDLGFRFPKLPHSA